RIKHGKLLRRIGRSIQKVELPDRGTFYRVLTGPISIYDRAYDLCNGLKEEGQDCLVLQSNVTKEPIL
ncbi:MAG: SPOR domain-containing protein, partial [Phycisphaerae bacterium]|nr:SPOR domain-containing protein [Phycisphaerae bacterium]NIU07723.1 SPOR domain-containing protein [Phycisphaerae bacterium]